MKLPWKKRKKESVSTLKKKLLETSNELKLRDRRLYEATSVERDNVLGTAPNQRQHWQARPLRNQARHLYENDPIARRLVDSIVCNMVGKGVRPIARGADQDSEATVRRYLNRWMETTDCDWDGNNNLSGIQALVVKSVVRDGAVFVRRVVKKRRLYLQVLEHDYLDVTRNGLNRNNNNQIVNGIEYDHRTEQVVAYWLWEYHPEDVSSSPGARNNFGVSFEIAAGSSTSNISGIGGKSLRVPAAEVAHVKKIDRAGQQDGASWLAPALIKLWDLREYEEAKLKQQKLQANFTAFVQDNYSLSEEERENILGMESSGPGGGPGVREISPGHIEDLPPGKTITFPSPTGTTDEKFVERSLRQIAAAVGVSYEIFNDYSQVSYSSGRMGFLEMDRNLKHLMKTVFEPQLLMRISGWITYHLELNGAIPSNHGITVSWTPPARELIDPGAESAALAQMVASNLMSMRQAHAILGQDFEETIRDILLSNDILESAGLSKLASFGGSATSADLVTPPKEEKGSDENPEEESSE